MVFVVGSGPAGIACAQALVEKKIKTTLLDYGATLEPERERALRRLAESPTIDWQPRDVELLKKTTRPLYAGMPVKRAYGSDFPYRTFGTALERHNAALSPSFALGGFSNVWGAAVQPYTETDLEGWPISAEELSPHYMAVGQFMKIAGHPPLRPNSQISAFMEDLAKDAARLQANGFRFGFSRLAVDADRCVYCGLCMYGCPYGLIYNSASTLCELLKSPDFEYRGGVLVEKLVEKSGSVEIIASEEGRKIRLESQRVYLAAGVVSTTRILIETLEAVDRELVIRDSQLFTFPLLRRSSVPDVQKEGLHTLAQLFFELRNSSVSAHAVHLQAYGFNDFFPSLVAGALRMPSAWVRRFGKPLLNRLLAVFGYLHSDDSRRIGIKLKKQNGTQSIVLRAIPNEETRPIVHRVIETFSKLRKSMKVLPFPIFAEIPEAGKGFHCGGSFPMKLKPNGFESDVFGRPCGLKRIHAVDATVFSSIPSSPITLTVMANAHRIASLHHAT